MLDTLIDRDIIAPTYPLTDERLAQITQQVYAQIDKDGQRIALAKLGRVLDWAGKFDEAYNLFTMSLELFGPHAFTYAMLGKTAHRAGMDDQAIEHLSTAAQIDNSNYTAHEELGILLASRGDFDAAHEHFAATLRLAPDDGTTLFTAFLVKAGRDEEATHWVQTMLEKDQHQAQTHNMMGVLLAKKGAFNQAIEHFREALRIKPDLKSAEDNLAKAQAATAHEKKAVASRVPLTTAPAVTGQNYQPPPRPPSPRSPSPLRAWKLSSNSARVSGTSNMSAREVSGSNARSAYLFNPAIRNPTISSKT